MSTVETDRGGVAEHNWIAHGRITIVRQSPGQFNDAVRYLRTCSQVCAESRDTISVDYGEATKPPYNQTHDRNAPASVRSGYKHRSCMAWTRFFGNNKHLCRGQHGHQDQGVGKVSSRKWSQEVSPLARGSETDGISRWNLRTKFDLQGARNFRRRL